MKHPFVISIFLAVTFQLHAQKVIQKQLQAQDVSTIKIDGNNSFRIHIKTAKIETISIQLDVEGENNEQVVLRTSYKQDSLLISTEYQPLFKANDDKLSAHKAISIVFNIIIPEQRNLYIVSDIGSVDLKGVFANVTTELINGHFTAEQFIGNALVNTIHGDISIETNYAVPESHTKNGMIHQELLTHGTNRLSLNSINGDITITKIQ